MGPFSEANRHTYTHIQMLISARETGISSKESIPCHVFHLTEVTLRLEPILAVNPCELGGGQDTFNFFPCLLAALLLLWLLCHFFLNTESKQVHF